MMQAFDVNASYLPVLLLPLLLATLSPSAAQAQVTDAAAFFSISSCADCMNEAACTNSFANGEMAFSCACKDGFYGDDCSLVGTAAESEGECVSPGVRDV